MKFMNNSLKSSALDILKGKWIGSIGVYLLYVLISFGLSYGGGLVFKDYINENILRMYGISFICSLLIAPALFGLTKYFIDMKNNEQKFLTLFKFYKGDLFFKAIGAFLLKMLYVTLKTALFIIPGIIAFFEYALFEYLIIKEPEIKVNDALKQSKEMMKGHKGELFSLYISFTGWYLFVILTASIIISIMLIFFDLFGITENWITIVSACIMVVSIVTQASIFAVYLNTTSIVFYDKIYNKFKGIEESEENNDIEEKNKIDKIRRKKITIAVIIVAVISVIMIAIASILVSNDIDNNDKYQKEMEKIYEAVGESENIDMNIYCTGELAEIEKYNKNLYQDLIEVTQEYNKDYEDSNLDNILKPSVLYADRPNMTKSIENAKLLVVIYEHFYDNSAAILDLDKIKNEMANIKMEETTKQQYIDSTVQDITEYLEYLKKDKELIMPMYDSYYNLIDFLAKHKGKWHAVGDQMYVDEEYLDEYNGLYNKVLEAEDNYYE